MGNPISSPSGPVAPWNLRRVRLLIELKHRGTLANVAAAMAYSAPSVSQQLALLEKEVGARLIEPDGRRVRLTPQAEILVARGEAVLELLDRAAADIATSLNEIHGTLRIASLQTTMLALVPAALTRLREQHPALRVEVTQAEPEVALPALLAREFDLAIVETYPGHPQPRDAEVTRELIAHDPMRLARSAHAPDVDTTSLRGLAATPWVMEPPGSPAREWTTAICRAHGFEPDVAYESSDMLVHARLVESGHATAFLPDLLWTQTTPQVTTRHLSPEHTRTLDAVARPGMANHPGINAICDALRLAAQQTGDGASP